MLKKSKVVPNDAAALCGRSAAVNTPLMALDVSVQTVQ